MNLRKLMLVPLLPMALTGCNDDIDTVKNARMQVNEQFTIDQAFSNRNICKSVDWEIITDDRNRKLVQYKCHIADIEPYYENERQRQKNNLVSYLASQQPQIKPFLESARVELESAEKSLNAPVLNKTPLEIDRLSALLNLSEMLNENPPWKSLRGYVNPPIGQELVSLSQRFYNQYPPDKSNPQRFAAYQQAEQELLQAIATVRPQLQAAIEEERARLAGIQQTRGNESSAYAQQRLAKAREAMDKLQGQYETQLAALDAERAQKLAAFDNAATIESVAEVFQWVVKGEQVELVWSGLEGDYSDGQVKRFGHENRLGSLRDVYSNTAKTYAELRQKAPLI
ncbi:hypothetical protein [Pseudomonas citronellolis]|uniref:hypothetical protein n=1 Tax=Pseudomonas citronellolis TaxID=53408 RepID=UPI0023E458D3|nr:hypothetical protein [Pseudomonas citronellolis]MDF3932178.1 hypothetical protein [Pseudomonas citronellolis]